MTDVLFARLRRDPDVEGAGLVAWDAADAYLLDEAAPLLPGRDVVVVGDGYGALTLGALDRGARSVRVHQDPLAGELALARNAARVGADATAVRSLPLAAELVDGAALVILRLPRAFAALDRIATLVAAHADPDVVLLAGGRIKHMSVGMNAVLDRSFGRVDVSLARRKSRLLTARLPRDVTEAVPDRAHLTDLDLTVVAAPGTFAGASLDIGTRELLAEFDRIPPAPRVLDLGCGTGLLAAAYARRHPAAQVIASDQSAAAVESARATIAANGLADRVIVQRDDAASGVPDASVDLVLLNPPFHTGAAVHGEVATRLFAAAARVLRPGGELWAVWNSPLGYRPRLERMVGPTRQVARGPKFTVTASVRRGGD